MGDILAVIIDLPTTIYSFVRENPDGTYTIVINARLSAEDRARHYLHEVRHIMENDFEKEQTADEIEYHAHKNRPE